MESIRSSTRNNRRNSAKNALMWATLTAVTCCTRSWGKANSKSKYSLRTVKNVSKVSHWMKIWVDRILTWRDVPRMSFERLVRYFYRFWMKLFPEVSTAKSRRLHWSPKMRTRPTRWVDQQRKRCQTSWGHASRLAIPLKKKKTEIKYLQTLCD